MPSALPRLLKLRMLLEESSRMKLESRSALVARIDRAQELERENIRDSRATAIKEICEYRVKGQVGQQILAWKNAESAARREQQLESMAQAAARGVSEAREEFLARRKERRQVESILHAEQTRADLEQDRRTQRMLDDWFGRKQARERARSKALLEPEDSLREGRRPVADSGT